MIIIIAVLAFMPIFFVNFIHLEVNDKIKIYLQKLFCFYLTLPYLTEELEVATVMCSFHLFKHTG